ncbi:MAG: hypothetical protein Q4D91_13195 [Lautropia sp.]|nr:hypothetical protein [Lautropia sp.]
MRSYLIGIMLATMSLSIQAAEYRIKKEAAPSQVLILNSTKQGMGTSRHSLQSINFPKGTLSRMKTLKAIEWKTTYFPRNTGEKVQLCYMRPYSTKEVGCAEIAPNGSGAVYSFNNERFGNGATVNIRHYVSGGDKHGRAAGKDVVIFHYYDK